jgi:hypothetical protein
MREILMRTSMDTPSNTSIERAHSPLLAMRNLFIAVVGTSAGITALVGSDAAATSLRDDGDRRPVSRKRRGTAVVVAEDDDLDNQIRPQLLAADVELSRFVFIPWSKLRISIPADMRKLKKAVMKSPDTRLLVINCNYAAFGKSTDEFVRRLRRLARRCEITIVLVLHVDTVFGGKRLQQVSERFAEKPTVDAVYCITPQDADRHVMIPLKNRNGYAIAGASFRVIQQKTATGQPSARLEWDSAPVPVIHNSAPVRRSSDAKRRKAT